MPPRSSGPSPQEKRLAAYLEGLAHAAGHADRHEPLKDYCKGLLLPSERKSIEPMAARLHPGRVQAGRQSLHHLVAKAPRDNEAVLREVRRHVLPVMQQRGPIVAWIADDTGIPKKGRHSVGVARQDYGQLGKQENCQVAVSLSAATGEASLPIGWRLSLPEEWARDRERRRRAGVPEEIEFETKPEIALGLIRRAVEEDVPTGVVLADAAYGSDTKFREGLAGLGLAYVVGVQSSLSLWRPGEEPLPPKPRQKTGRPPKLLRRSEQQKPVSVRELVREAPEKAFRTVRWREGGRGWLASRFSRGAGAADAQRLLAQRASRRALAAGGVAARGGRAHEILAVESACGDAAEEAGRAGQASLDCRARLPGAEAGTRTGAFRRPFLAWVSPSRDAVHCGVRVPGGRKEPFFGLGPRRATRAPRAAAAGGIRAAGRSWTPAAGLIRTRSRACGRKSRSRFSGSFPAALFAAQHIYDPVVLRRRTGRRRSCTRIWIASVGRCRTGSRNS